ncbi:MAG: hypothetical protein ABSF81_16145 [Bacteroidales bacterium]
MFAGHITLILFSSNNGGMGWKALPANIASALACAVCGMCRNAKGRCYHLYQLVQITTESESWDMLTLSQSHVD